MPLVVLGTSHHNAPIALRERLAFPAHDLGPALASARETGLEPDLAGSELVILSTCNRTELYLAADAADPAYAALVSFLGRARGVTPEVLLPHSYRRAGLEALHHLCA
ncbi:MAG TPA: hypothetical protein VNH46_10355, partial [Gemmatimonadales bacterium]|nr:hypothetical protein [Gemmatimonadales bacterium]